MILMFKFIYPIRLLRILSTPVLLSLVQSCSSSPIGQELSNSFDAPMDKNSAEIIKQEKVNILTPNSSKEKVQKITSVVKVPKKKNINPTVTIISQNKKVKKEEKITNFNPLPYRITIKLSGANPSAPAETVTKALRMAGVKFEVEMIELVENQSMGEKSKSRRR